MTKGRLALPLLIAVIGSPVVLGWLILFNPEWLPERGSNSGELVTPVKKMADLTLDDRLGPPFPLASLRGRWVLLLYRDGCDAACRELLLTTRQVRTALGPDRERVQRLLILERVPSAGLQAEIRRRHPDIRVIAPSGVSLTHLRERLRDREVFRFATAFIIDPRGDLMMRYGLDMSGKGILKDLQRLMKISM